MSVDKLQLIKKSVYTIPNYPIEGVMFRDVMGILENADAFKATIDLLAEKYKDQQFTKIVGTEARGFLFGAPLAIALGVGFVPVRKPGKLPRNTFSQDYQLEYGQDSLEIHQDALSKEDNVLIIDDLLATGGTVKATTQLIRKLGATANHAAFIISLPELGGEKVLTDINLELHSLIQFEGE